MTLALHATLFLSVSAAAAGPLTEAGDPVDGEASRFRRRVRAFDDPEAKPVSWWPHVVNAAWGEGRGGPERNGGWLDQNWELVDYLDRSADYTTHEYLTHRGIWYEVYGSNEYQETIHFHEEGAKELFWDNGIARDMRRRARAQPALQHEVPLVEREDRLGRVHRLQQRAPLVGGDQLRLADQPAAGLRRQPGQHRRADVPDRRRSRTAATATSATPSSSTTWKRPAGCPSFGRQYGHIRDYVQENLMDVDPADCRPHVKRHRFNAEEAELMAKLAEPPVMSEYQKFLYLSHLHNFVRYYRDAKLVAGRQGREYRRPWQPGRSAHRPLPVPGRLVRLCRHGLVREQRHHRRTTMFKYGWNNARRRVPLRDRPGDDARAESRSCR